MEPSERSLRALCALLGKKAHYHRQLAKWSTTHGWQERVRAYEAHLAQLKRDALAEARAEALDLIREHAVDAAESLIALATSDAVGEGVRLGAIREMFTLIEPEGQTVELRNLRLVLPNRRRTGGGEDG